LIFWVPFFYINLYFKKNGVHNFTGQSIDFRSQKDITLKVKIGHFKLFYLRPKIIHIFLRNCIFQIKSLILQYTFSSIVFLISNVAYNPPLWVTPFHNLLTNLRRRSSLIMANGLRVDRTRPLWPILIVKSDGIKRKWREQIKFAFITIIKLNYFKFIYILF
jgi:hypothetical protein